MGSLPRRHKETMKMRLAFPKPATGHWSLPLTLGALFAAPGVTLRVASSRTRPCRVCHSERVLMLSIGTTRNLPFLSRCIMREHKVASLFARVTRIAALHRSRGFRFAVRTEKPKPPTTRRRVLL